MKDGIPYDETQFAILLVGYLCLFPLLVFVLVRQRERLADLLGEHAKRGLLLAVLVGLVLRALWPDLTVFHENGHGYRLIGMAVEPSSDLHVYGSGYQAFFHLIFQVLPSVTGVVLVTNVLLGTATIFFGGLLGSAVFGSRAGVFGAWALACLPVHIKLSATESPFVLSIFLAAVALWAVHVLRSRSCYAVAIVAGLAAALAAQGRPMMIAVPFYVLLFGMACPAGGLRWLRERTTWVFLAVMAAVLTLHVSWLLELHGDGGRLGDYGQFLERGPERVWSTMIDRGLLLDPFFTPAHFIALAFLGFAVSWQNARRGALILMAGFLGMAWAYGARANHYSEALRFAAAPQVFMALLMGPALARSVDWIQSRWPGRPRLSYAPALGLVAAGLFAHHAITTPTADALEYGFLQESIEKAPAGCALITPPARMGRGRIETSFPFYEFRERNPGNDHYNWGLARVDQPMWDGLRHNNSCVIYYRGLGCTSFLPEEGKAEGLRQPCQDFEDTFELEALHKAKFDGTQLPRHLHRHPDGEYELGLFRVLRKR